MIQLAQEAKVVSADDDDLRPDDDHDESQRARAARFRSRSSAAQLGGAEELPLNGPCRRACCSRGPRAGQAGCCATRHGAATRQDLWACALASLPARELANKSAQFSAGLPCASH